MTSDCYVSTRAIRAAVKGRETEVLEALGMPGVIAGRGAPHWRWRLEVGQ
jgi:hypothetical protein